MKKLLIILGFLFFTQVSAQTFPVQNLQVNGAATVVGNTTLGGTLSVAGATSFANPPTVATTATIYPTVSSNVTLKALSTVGVAAVTRLGFTNSGDVEPVVYVALASPCPLNGGAGDNGSQVQSSNGQCWIANMPQPNNVQEWGAIPDGVTDDTGAIQSTINYAQTQSNPGPVYLPAGSYKISSNLAVTRGVRIFGDGMNSTIIYPSVSTTAFAVNTPQAVQISGMLINYSTAQNAGLYAITITASAGQQNSLSVLRDVQIANANSGVQFTNADLFLMDHCFIENFPNFGVQVSNAVDIDNGDSIITNSTFFEYIYTTGIGVDFLSSGGLRVENNKFGAEAYGVLLNYATDAGSSIPNTAQLIVTGNSFDTVTSAAVQLQRQTNTDVFNSVIIANNLMPDCGNGVVVPLDANGVWLSSLIIMGNVYLSPATGSPVGVSIQSTKNVSVNGNSFWSQNNNTVGITIGSSVTGGLVQLNNLAASPNTFSTTIFNGGTNVIVANNAT